MVEDGVYWSHAGGCRQASNQVQYAMIISVSEEELSEIETGRNSTYTCLKTRGNKAAIRQ